MKNFDGEACAFVLLLGTFLFYLSVSSLNADFTPSRQSTGQLHTILSTHIYNPSSPLTVSCKRGVLQFIYKSTLDFYPRKVVRYALMTCSGNEKNTSSADIRMKTNQEVKLFCANYPMMVPHEDGVISISCFP